tara:strand:+ start:273 stop:413 length:141 start_codon:yes stop_codon:yes gene_type:complete
MDGLEHALNKPIEFTGWQHLPWAAFIFAVEVYHLGLLHDKRVAINS